nr:uncharacterized protein LOC105481034 isoform X2 [Macaca nemestrina]
MAKKGIVPRSQKAGDGTLYRVPAIIWLLNMGKPLNSCTAKRRLFLLLRLNKNILQGVCSLMQPEDQVIIIDIDTKHVDFEETGMFAGSCVSEKAVFSKAEAAAFYFCIFQLT